MFGDILSYIFYVALPLAFAVFWSFAPIWLPIIAAVAFWQLWVAYVQAQDISKREHILLEVKLPKEQQKSPLAMELVLNALHERAGESNAFQRYWQGGTRPWFSLEIISIEGDIRFFFWTQKKFKALIEHQVYAQYPDVEISEAPDYTDFIKYDRDKIGMFCLNMIPVKKDVYPIKTYIDYGLDKDPKEEVKIDPMTPMLEFLGALGPGEQAWYQILIRFHKKRPKNDGNVWENLVGQTEWQKDAEKEIDDLLKRDSKTKLQKVDDKNKEDKFPLKHVISEGEAYAAAAIERSLSKNAFDVGISAIYLAETDKFRGINISGLIGSWRQYASNDLNGLKPDTPLFKFSYPWQDYKSIRQNKIKVGYFDAYRRRSYFHWPYKKTPFVMTTEELATIFHFPGSVVKTPSFQRIEAKKTEPPSNLPV